MRQKLPFYSIIFYLLVSFLFGSCKGGNSDPEPAKRYLITSTTYSYPFDLANKKDGLQVVNSIFNYNSNKQISSVVETTNYYQLSNNEPLASVKTTQTMNYLPGSIEIKSISVPSASRVISQTYAVNSINYISETSVILENTDTGVIYTDKATYVYDLNGYLTRQQLDNGSYILFEYNNGNLSVIKSYDSMNKMTGLNTYSYYEDVMLTTPIVGGYNFSTVFYSLGLLGKTNKNPLKQNIQENLVNPGKHITEYYHTYDANGNINMSISREVGRLKPGVVETDTTRYSYKYN